MKNHTTHAVRHPPTPPDRFSHNALTQAAMFCSICSHFILNFNRQQITVTTTTITITTGSAVFSNYGEKSRFKTLAISTENVNDSLSQCQKRGDLVSNLCLFVPSPCTPGCCTMVKRNGANLYQCCTPGCCTMATQNGAIL